jgi:catechol 2,3-dioxygenase-like lactoylglutathione lyase family enzyme
MKIEETGFLLRVENYEECVKFYSEVLEFRVRYQIEGLSNFQFGNAYLLLEKAWEPSPREIRERDNPPFILRINVRDLVSANEEIKLKGIETHVFSSDWGDVANFRDPAGNLVEFCKWKVKA